MLLFNIVFSCLCRVNVSETYNGNQPRLGEFRIYGEKIHGESASIDPVVYFVVQCDLLAFLIVNLFPRTYILPLLSTERIGEYPKCFAQGGKSLILVKFKVLQVA